MWNQSHSLYGFNLERNQSHIDSFKIGDVDCYHNSTTGKYYAFLGFVGSKKVEVDTREELENIIINS